MYHTRLILSALFIALSGYLLAQTGSEGAFRSAANPHYWKNKKPHAAYWQQDVYYKIQATMNDSTDVIGGSLSLVYWNNSPDTLKELYFHLFQNAFQPGSYMDDAHLHNKVRSKFGRYEAQGLGTTVKNITQEETYLNPEMDNTIMRIKLTKPIPPGGSTRLSMGFDTYFDQGTMRRRMKIFKHNGVKHYDGVHWYPRVCVYDNYSGWNTNQHLGREFYSNFGSYDVSLTFPDNYIMEATGVLQNKNEVLPPELLEKIDIKNYNPKKLQNKEEKPYQYTIPRTGNKTWHYHADNVHNFAFTADPTYRLSSDTIDGVEVVAIAQEANAYGWQDAVAYTKRVIHFYNRFVGPYGWPKIVAADARDGMEYPMLTLNGGTSPGYYYLIAHEVGHMWFYGMVGNNETYRAMLDEGFTQFISAVFMDNLSGRGHETYDFDSSAMKSGRESGVYKRYIMDAVQGNDAFLNTHSDDFGTSIRHGGGYGHVYYKTATMLYNLWYTLGDSLFRAAFKNYFNEWSYCHPYPQDFRNSFIRFTGQDLNWFFDQWMETKKTLDIKITKFRRVGKKSDNNYRLTLRRVGDMQTPVDFSVKGKSGALYHYHIPNRDFVKAEPAAMTTLPAWKGWGRLRDTYSATFSLPEKSKMVMLDPTMRMADVNMLNNVKPEGRRKRTKYYWEPAQVARYNRGEYEVNTFPDVWYNHRDRAKIGWHWNSNYMNTKDVNNFTFWFNTAALDGIDSKPLSTSNPTPVSFKFDWRHQVTPGQNALLDLRMLDGLTLFKAGWEWNLKKNVYSIDFRTLGRMFESDLDYLLYRDQWNVDQWNTSVNVGWHRDYKYFYGEGKIKATGRASAFTPSYAYSRLNLEVTNNNRLGNTAVRTRFFAQYMEGTIAPESQLAAAGANNEELMDSKFTRAAGFVPDAWVGYGNDINHFQQGGGLNLRGYAGYLLPGADGSFFHLGRSGVSGSAEWDVTKAISWKPRIFKPFKLRGYLFGDAGVIQARNTWSSLLADAGAGAALQWQPGGRYRNLSPLVIRFDMPLWVSNAPFVSSGNFAFRYVMGFGMSF